MKKIKRILPVIMIGLIVSAILPLNHYVFADTNYEIEEEIIEPTEEEYVICDDAELEFDIPATRLVSTYTVNFKRISSKSAQASVNIRAVNSKTITSKVYLQKWNGSAYANVKGVSSSKTVKNTSRLIHNPKFSISSTGKYRIKVVVNDGTGNKIKYKNLQ